MTGLNAEINGVDNIANTIHKFSGDVTDVEDPENRLELFGIVLIEYMKEVISKN